MLIFFWIILACMWCSALCGMYLRGNLDALDWSKRLLAADVRDNTPWRTDWKGIAFYVVPLALFTAFAVFMTVKGG